MPLRLARDLGKDGLGWVFAEDLVVGALGHVLSFLKKCLPTGGSRRVQEPPLARLVKTENLSARTHIGSMADAESMYEHTLPTAKAFINGSYDLESVMHGFYLVDSDASVRAWADAVVGATCVRGSLARELKLAARMFTRTYYGTHDKMPAAAMRNFEIFAYNLTERVLKEDSGKVELVLDIVGALHEVIVVPAETPTLGILLCLEASSQSIVYFKSGDSSLPAWGAVLVEALSRRVLEDDCAFDHARFSDPSRIVFQRCAYSTADRSSSARALISRIGRENSGYQRGVRNAQIDGCLVRSATRPPATRPAHSARLGRQRPKTAHTCTTKRRNACKQHAFDRTETRGLPFHPRSLGKAAGLRSRNRDRCVAARRVWTFRRKPVRVLLKE